MSSAELVELGGGRFKIKGVLDFSSVGALLPRGSASFSGRRQVELDLQGVTRSDSSALALLLEWMDLGRTLDFELRFRNLPNSLLAIARMSNVDDLLVQAHNQD